MILRLQKFLADAGVASRRKSEELIAEGRVSVNNEVITEQGVKIDDQLDLITVDGKVVKPQKNHVYIILNKPEGYVTTVKDQFDRPTVMSLIKGVEKRIVPVGRLDYDTSGLLLMTNDGELTYKFTHPKHNVEKVYVAKVFGTPDTNDMLKLKMGVYINGVKTESAKVLLLESGERYSFIQITIHEGKNRQVRKMCETIKHPVSSLKRVAEGELKLGDLPKGKYRYLTEEEIKYLKSV
ncbi:MAG: pseudouridine synthase [Lachnospiraceae bacterium]|nr:pseudouridine synthase [Lachnospiraceae bacterium]